MRLQRLGLHTLWVALLLLPLALVQTLPGPDADPMRSVYEAEHERLSRIRDHLPESPQRLKMERKLRTLELQMAGEPIPGHPDEFARILEEMTIAADEVVPGYAPSYRRAELERVMAVAPAKRALPWQERGPGNVSGRARGLIVDPGDPTGNTWWVGSVGGGIWKTTDAGTTWLDMAPDLANLPISWIVMAESDNDIMYAGTGESFYNVDTINGNGVLKSTDGGNTWFQLASTVDNIAFNNVARIVVDPNDPDVVLVAASAGRYKVDLYQRSSIWKSTDGGTTFTEVFAETDLGSFSRVKKVLQIVATPGNFNTLFATVDEKGILRSTDAGDTWTFENTGITDFSGRFELAISPVDTDRIYAASEGSPSNLWRSDDGGDTWVETFDTGSEPNWLGSQGWYDNTIVCHPTDVDVVYVGGIRLWKLTMTGPTSRTNVQLSVGPVHVDHHNLVIIPGSPWRILNANDGGIGVSGSQDTNWSKPTLGMNTSQFYGVDKRPGSDAYIGGMQDNGTWRSPVDTQPLDLWTFQIGGDGYETSWHFNDPMKIVGGYQFNGIQRSLDGGQSWQNAQPGDSGGGNAPFITKVGKTNANPDLLFAVGAQGVWRSTDFADTWTLVPLSAPDWAPISSFTDVRVSRADPDVVWAGARMDATGKIHVSTDGGLTFNPTTNYTTATMGGISGLATHPTQPGTAFTLFSFASRPKVLRTTDYGVTWTDISGFGAGTVSTNGFPDVAVYDLLVFPHDPNTIWVGTEIGLIESTDAGATWHAANNGLPNLPIWFMTHVEDEIVLASHGRGIWSVEIPALVNGETWNPLIDNLFQGPDGFLTLEANLRSAYDNTDVLLNGAVYQTLDPNPAKDVQTLKIPVAVNGTWTVQLESQRGGGTYASPVKSVDVYALEEPIFTYTNDFNSGGSDFALTDFTVGPEGGFSSDALHTPHDYPNNANSIALLRTPIVVAPSNALIEFDEVVIVEPGEPGSTFGDFDFWDYVIVEGSLDGSTWLPLLDGYDARDDPDWVNAYNGNDPGDSSMLRHRVIDILDTFSPGDHILVRFRLYADSFVTSWGWVIENLTIQLGPTAVDPIAPRFALEQNHPNPFNPKTTIQYQIPHSGDVSLKVYDVRGRLVRTLVAGFQPAGRQAVEWDGTDERGAKVASGSYVYRVVAGEFVDQRKMTLVK